MTPTELCEGLLRADIERKTDSGILRSENEVAERLLARRTELVDAYAELVGKTGGIPSAIGTFMTVLLVSAAFWNPEATARIRRDRGEIRRVNENIAARAKELQALLRHRSELQSRSGLTDDTYYHVCDVIRGAAAKHVPLFAAWIEEPLDALASRFDLKYWPSIPQFLGELAEDAHGAKPQAWDRATAAATDGERASPTDFFSHLFQQLDRCRSPNGGMLSEDFELSDSALASFANCALDAHPDKPMDAVYVKGVRQRLRQR